MSTDTQCRLKHSSSTATRVDASDGETFDVFDPSSGRTCSRPSPRPRRPTSIARCKSAQAALESKAWGGLAPAERGRIMLRIAQALRDRAEELATLESRDNGKPLRQARTDVQVAARYFEFFAGIADKIMGNTIPLGPGLSRLHGARADRRVGADRAVELSDSDRRARRRAGARRRLHGRAEAVERSADDRAPARRDRRSRAGCRPACSTSCPAPDRKPAPRSPAIPTSTSSRSPARSRSASQVAKMAAENVVPVVMELGGKSPNIVFADADLDLAAQGVAERDLPERRPDVLGRVAPARRAKAHDALVERLAGAREGDARRPGRERSGHGADHLEAPARDHRALRRRSASDEGARVAAGGERPADPVARARLLLRADAARSRVAGHARRAGRDLRPGARDHRRSTTSRRRRRSPIAASTAWSPASGRATSTRRWRSRRASSPARSTSTPTAPAAASSCRSAATRRAATAARKGLESLASYTQVKNVCVKFA